jgi:hypothetical protein
LQNPNVTSASDHPQSLAGVRKLLKNIELRQSLLRSDAAYRHRRTCKTRKSAGFASGLLVKLPLENGINGSYL